MGSIVSHLLHFSESILVCITCSSLVTCLVFFLAITLLLGIGLGYNNCYIDFKSKHRYVPAQYEYKYQPTPFWRAGIDEDNETIEYDSKLESESDTTKFNDTYSGLIHPYSNEPQSNETFSTVDKEYGLLRTESHRETENGFSEVPTRSKIMIPMSDLDLISLLSKWRAENRNYSLQVFVD